MDYIVHGVANCQTWLSNFQGNISDKDRNNKGQTCQGPNRSTRDEDEVEKHTEELYKNDFII